MALADARDLTVAAIDEVLSDVDAAKPDEHVRMARFAAELLRHVRTGQKSPTDALEALEAVQKLEVRAWIVSELTLRHLLVGKLEESESIASFGLEAGQLGVTPYGPRLWLLRAEAARLRARWEDADAYLDEAEASLPETKPQDELLCREFHECRSRLFQARAQILLELGILERCREAAKVAVAEAIESGEPSARVAAELLAFDQALMSRDTAAAADRAHAVTQVEALAPWHPFFHLAEGVARVEQVRESVKTGKDATELAETARAALEAARREDLPATEQLKLALALCDLEACLDNVDAARAHLERARAAAGPDAEAREAVLLASLAWRLVSHGVPEEVSKARAAVFEAYKTLLEQWASTPQRPGGVGFLHLAWRAQIVSDVLDAELSDPAADGAARAFARLLEAQALGTEAREHATGPTLAAVKDALIVPGRGIIVLFPARDRTHLFLLDDQGVAHEAIEVGRDELRDSAGAITGALFRPDGEVKLDELRALQERLLPAEARARLARWKECITVGFDVLRDLPFGILPGEGGKPYGQRIALVTLPSLAKGIELARREVGAADDSPSKGVVLVVAGDPEDESLDPIPFGADERKRLLAPFREGRTTVLEGKEATLEHFRASGHLFAGARVLHLFAHGVVLPGEEFSAALALNRAEEPGESVLRAADVAALRFGGLVILSACGSGRGPLRMGDDRLVNLGGAFLGAGARCVVLSRFPVEYRTTLALMEHFHAHLVAGKSPAVALRAAREAVGSEDALAAFQCASFEVIGLGFEPVLAR